MNKKIIASSFILALSLGFSVKSTFALFTSSDEATISVKAGSVNVEASMSGLTLYSPKSIDPDDCSIIDDTNIADNDNLLFANKGTASIEDGGVLALNNISCGDKASFVISITNNSTIAIKYRVVYKDITVYSTNPAPTYKLVDKLNVTVGDSPVAAIVTPWTELEAEGTIDDLAVSVELPADVIVNYLNLGCNLQFSIEAVQANALTEAPEDPYWWNKVKTSEDYSTANTINFVKTYTPGSDEIKWAAPHNITAYLDTEDEDNIILTYSLNGADSLVLEDEDEFHFGFVVLCETPEEQEAKYIEIYNEMFNKTFTSYDDACDDYDTLTEDEQTAFDNAYNEACIQINHLAAKVINGLDLIDVSNLTDLSYFFSSIEECTELNGLDAWADKTGNVTSMEGMFEYSCNLTDLSDISEWDTSSVETFEHMFYECNSLETLDVSKFDTSSCVNMSGMFYQCFPLENLTFDSECWDTSLVTDMSYMFGECYDVPSLDISCFDTSSCTNMEGMFKKCYSVSPITFGDDFDTSLVTSMASMFKECKSLESIDLSGFDTSSCEKFVGMFSECETITIIDISTFVDDGCNSMSAFSGMFNSCTALVKIYATENFNPSSFVTPNVVMSFYSGDSLIGGQGSSFTKAYMDKARIDRYVENGTDGVFTEKGNQNNIDPNDR